jgi:hypothetical protein
MSTSIAHSSPRCGLVTSPGATVTRVVWTDDPRLLEPWLDAKCRDDPGVIYVRASLPAVLRREQVHKAIHEARRLAAPEGTGHVSRAGR